MLAPGAAHDALRDVDQAGHTSPMLRALIARVANPPRPWTWIDVLGYTAAAVAGVGLAVASSMIPDSTGYIVFGIVAAVVFGALAVVLALAVLRRRAG